MQTDTSTLVTAGPAGRVDASKLKIGFLADRYMNPDAIGSWSGLPYYFARGLRAAGCQVVTVRAEREPFELPRKVRQAYWKYVRGRRYLRDLDPAAMRVQARGWEARLRHLDVDLVFSASSWPLAELDTPLPTVFWTDATFAAMRGFYGSFSNLVPASYTRGMLVENMALKRCALAVYSSDWAAASAIRDHGGDPAKVRVLSFGANLEKVPGVEEVRAMISGRTRAKECRLVLVGVNWERKGAGVAVETINELRRLGVAARLQIAGCNPPKDYPLPEGVEIVGFLDKNSREGQEHLAALYRDAHFFIMPSRAEAYGVVFCEAAAFGLPSVAASIGGVPSIIRDGENGQLFPPTAAASDYARWIAGVWRQPHLYTDLARGALDSYHQRLNAPRSIDLLVDYMIALAKQRSTLANESRIQRANP